MNKKSQRVIPPIGHITVLARVIDFVKTPQFLTGTSDLLSQLLCVIPEFRFDGISGIP